MAAPDITLNAGQVLLSQTVTTQSITPINGNLLFGLVELVSELSDKYEGGEVVFFDPDKSIIIQWSSTDYYLIDEQYVFFKEAEPT